jgi:hypothetical protein
LHHVTDAWAAPPTSWTEVCTSTCFAQAIHNHVKEATALPHRVIPLVRHACTGPNRCARRVTPQIRPRPRLITGRRTRFRRTRARRSRSIETLCQLDAGSCCRCGKSFGSSWSVSPRQRGWLWSRRRVFPLGWPADEQAGWVGIYYTPVVVPSSSRYLPPCRCSLVLLSLTSQRFDTLHVASPQTPLLPP